MPRSRKSAITALLLAALGFVEHSSDNVPVGDVQVTMDKGEGLHFIVQRDARNLRYARDRAADHQYHSELSQGMCESQGESGADAAPGQGCV